MTRARIQHALVVVIVLVCAGLTTTEACAQQPPAPYERGQDTPSAAAMGLDLLLVRPLGLVSTVAGTGVFILSLPFTWLGGNVDDAARVLVADPGKYTFVRPLGDFETRH